MAPVPRAGKGDELAVRDAGALAPHEGARPPDLYEQKFMEGDGLVLYRAREVAPWQLHALLLSPAGVVVVATILSGQLAGLLGLPLILMIWLTFLALRVTVSEGAVNVQYGPIGPTIPIRSISEAKATTYDWKKFGGWGIKRSFAGEWIYNMPGDGGRAVRVCWRDAKGRDKVTLIGSRDPDSLADAIARARGALPAAAEQAALPSADD